MTRAHTLSAGISREGLSLTLSCPYDGESEEDLATYPEWMRPVCRPAGAASCQASPALAAPWGGPPAPLGDLPVHVWAEGGGFRIAAAQLGGQLDASGAARELATASRSPRYGGGQWRKLLESVSDVDYAWREAVRFETPRYTADILRAQLVLWHAQPPG